MFLFPVLLQLLHQLTERWYLLRQQVHICGKLYLQYFGTEVRSFKPLIVGDVFEPWLCMYGYGARPKEEHIPTSHTK